MEFKHPITGYTETKYVPWLWTLLFGGMYFLVNGLWASFVVWLMISIALVVAMGPGAIVGIGVLSLVCASIASELIRGSYLRKGWIEVGTEEEEISLRRRPPAPEAAKVTPVVKTKSCPFCAETIKYEAIKCRFCGSDLTQKKAASE